MLHQAVHARIAALEDQRAALDETLAELHGIVRQTTQTLAARKAS